MIFFLFKEAGSEVVLFHQDGGVGEPGADDMVRPVTDVQTVIIKMKIKHRIEDQFCETDVGFKVSDSTTRNIHLFSELKENKRINCRIKRRLCWIKH